MGSLNRLLNIIQPLNLRLKISDKETFFLDTYVYKSDRFKDTTILDVRTHPKLTETFQYTHLCSCHPTGVSKGFIKDEALRLVCSLLRRLQFGGWREGKKGSARGMLGREGS